jgi:hypothetical protein
MLNTVKILSGCPKWGLPHHVVPTDEQYKTEVKRVEKPPKEETVEQTLKRSRFAKK